MEEGGKVSSGNSEVGAVSSLTSSSYQTLTWIPIIHSLYPLKSSPVRPTLSLINFAGMGMI